MDILIENKKIIRERLAGLYFMPHETPTTKELKAMVAKRRQCRIELRKIQEQINTLGGNHANQ